MKIKIDKQNEMYIADCVDLPGMPPIGMGDTQDIAVKNLLFNLLLSESDKFNLPIEIEDESSN